MKRLLRYLLISALLAVVVVAWREFAPTRLGGRTTYITTSGTSMAPTYHTGDLVLVRPQSRYTIGDVVAYRSSELRTSVLHRIVADEDGRFVMKGDRNDWSDPERPSADALIGTSWLRIPHGGRVLVWLANPIHVLSLVLLTFAFAGSKTSRRSRTEGAPESEVPAAAFCVM